jgi:hypothetical protein
MLTTLRKSAKKLFLVVVAAIFFAAGTISVYASTFRFIHRYEDGSFLAVSCGSSAGPTLVLYDAQLNQTFAFPAQPSLCEQPNQ